ncbi:maltose ABC transporter permease [Enterococcus faecium]|jgi:arabinogalactan oligomer/maltooligosaccharide transport system permease protein|uniref:Maltose ABC transporter permease n=2 Tax=Enterococcus faecium TaxID=1352 RepID=A0A1B5FSB2_ENTFC|nr:maltose ABC superfamily ATP binding cassette transporter, permease protein [Enterococcus faecium DO]AQY30112.1 maltose ABC transporter permease [Enterococcus faecium]EEV45924.1 maltose ABC transporter [Enterococcus faecium 1,231,502]EEV52269.1 maltose ABC transporter [Enterococcus faecium 1,231,410]EFF29897.1 sugar ABC transporter, permease protein [Enterococcus faecium U0317]EFF35299.1 sugar ABC transporter, permease protein [Enterococcus faecium E1162]
MAVPQFISLLIMHNLLNDAGPVNTLLENWGWIEQFLS